MRVDQDANPDLSSRYGDWGWPATIVFGPDGTEIAKIRGYIEPERMQALRKPSSARPLGRRGLRGEAGHVRFLPGAREALTKNS